MKRFLPFAIIGAVFLCAVGAGLLLFQVKNQRIAGASAAAAAAMAKAPSSSTLGANPPHVRGPTAAAVTLEEFGDFQCPSCAALSPALNQAEQKYHGKLCIIFRQFPLAIHKHAQAAGRAAEAAGLQNRFWEMHDLLYGSQMVWRRAADPQELFDQFAKSLGLDLERFKVDMESEPVRVRINADQQRAASLGVNSTPAIFIDGHRVPNSSLNQKALQEAIDSSLNQKGH